MYEPGGSIRKAAYGVRLTVVGNMIDRPAPKNRCCRNRLSSPSVALLPTNWSALKSA